MSYTLAPNKLRVCRRVSQHSTAQLNKTRFVILQQLKSDTLEFIEYLEEAGAQIDYVIGKHYSSDPKVLRKLRAKKLPVRHIETLAAKDYLSILAKSVKLAKAKRQKVVVLDIGGFFRDAALALSPTLRKSFAGVVEDTTYGYNRYKSIGQKLTYPVYYVGKSQLKKIEAHYVGEAIVNAFFSILAAQDVLMVGKNYLVIGYGMISSNVAKHLKRRQAKVTVYDVDHLKTLTAFVDGFDVILNKGDLSQFDAVISSTGTTALSIEDMTKLNDGVILASGSSQDIEFDLANLKSQASKSWSIGKEIEVFQLFNKRVLVLRAGTPINFRSESVPGEIIDLVMAQIIVSAVRLVSNDDKIKPGIHQLKRAECSQIAHTWLELKTQ